MQCSHHAFVVQHPTADLCALVSVRRCRGVWFRNIPAGTEGSEAASEGGFPGFCFCFCSCFFRICLAQHNRRSLSEHAPGRCWLRGGGLSQVLCIAAVLLGVVLCVVLGPPLTNWSHELIESPQMADANRALTAGRDKLPSFSHRSHELSFSHRMLRTGTGTCLKTGATL